MAIKYAPGSLSFAVARQATAEATQRMLVATAKRKHAEVMRTDPRPSKFTRIVDGREGAAEETVKPAGVITYVYPRLEAVVQYAMEVLFDLSPVLSRDYRNSHTIFVDGTLAASLKDLAEGGEVAITNPQPYSRKIELGIMKMRVPASAMVYQQAVRKVRARYGNLAKITFTYRGIVGGTQVNQGRAASAGQPWWFGGGAARDASGSNEIQVGKKFGKTAHNRSSLRFPTMVISER